MRSRRRVPRPDGDPVVRRRLDLSRGIERLLASSHGGTLRGPLAPRGAVRAAGPALTLISAILHDTHRPLDAAALADVERFLTDGARSPLYGHDGDHALTAAESLAARLADEE